MSGRFPRNTLTLQQFMLRQQVISLYRDFMKATRSLPQDERTLMRSWIRDDFKQHQHLTEEIDIKMQLTRGRLSLKEVTAAINQAK